MGPRPNNNNQRDIRGRRPGEEFTRTNQQIRVPAVRCLLPDGSQLGVVATRDALYKAQQMGLDLVEVSKDLPRIKDLGSDVIYLMPIHEIGEENRKGTWGSPYAIKDYFSISPDLGTLDDLKELINKTHELGMKIILDMVFNHTSPDNVLVATHPEYYFYKDGKRGNRVGDWTDIVDLDTPREDVQDYLVSVLKYWLDVGVDGFRFDVASTIPLSLFEKARKILGNKPIFLVNVSVKVLRNIYKVSTLSMLLIRI